MTPSRRGRSRRTLATLAVGLLAVIAGLVAHQAGALQRVEDDTTDLRFHVRGATTPRDLLVVAIDDATFSDLRRQWPFPRSLHGEAIDRLRRAGARGIVYDVQFTEPTRPREDMALYSAVARARNVVLATTEVDEHGRTNVLGGQANLARAHAVAGAANLPTEAGGEIRRLTPSLAGLPTLAVAAAGGARSVPSFPHGGGLIDYRGPPGTVRTVSFSDLLAGRVDPSLIRGRVVVVGASAPTLQDVHPTPTSGGALMSGPEVQANAIWSVMHGLPLRAAPDWLGIALIVVLGLVGPLAALWIRPSRAALIALGVGVLYVLACYLAFRRNLVVPAAYPLLALAVGAVGTVAAGYLLEARERRRDARDREVLEGLVRERTRELRESQLEIVRRLAQAAESRDTDTGAHIERMSRLCEQLALQMGIDARRAELLRQAAALHDVGKIAVPDSILHKPGRLDQDEQDRMRAHTIKGAEILAGSKSLLLQLAEQIALTHHEHWDGTGYPRGLKGDEVPLSGRICAICDVYDALTSVRPYKEAWSHEQALAEIRRQAGKQFDPAVVEAFLRLKAPAVVPQAPPEVAATAPQVAGDPAPAR